MHSESLEDHYDFSSGIPIKKYIDEVVLGADSLLTLNQITKISLKILESKLCALEPTSGAEKEIK